ncbi:hypothetical protein LSTR_LSTR012452 [Laodelphax striatellus]|uniref:Uncharacterized protein n=1 Tax=Laodelphax striatellus TaxID=195883 RepID=A0A482XKG6_LAOST|nr:hypothetical protein LSTR_LSTR012452 [Laodelphax striatellus]
MAGSWSTLSLGWKSQAKEFFNKSTLHGVRYIAETDRPIYERFIWLVLTTTGGVITMLIILSLWSKFQTNATITGLDTDFHNWDAPFPAVTVCPQHPLNDTRVTDYIQR